MYRPHVIVVDCEDGLSNWSMFLHRYTQIDKGYTQLILLRCSVESERDVMSFMQRYFWYPHVEGLVISVTELRNRLTLVYY